MMVHGLINRLELFGPHFLLQSVVKVSCPSGNLGFGPRKSSHEGHWHYSVSVFAELIFAPEKKQLVLSGKALL